MQRLICDISPSCIMQEDKRWYIVFSAMHLREFLWKHFLRYDDISI